MQFVFRSLESSYIVDFLQVIIEHFFSLALTAKAVIRRNRPLSKGLDQFGIKC